MFGADLLATTAVSAKGAVVALSYCSKYRIVSFPFAWWGVILIGVIFLGVEWL